MTKAQLIQALQDVPDDALLSVWNGMVGDTQPLAGLEVCEEAKMTFETYVERVLMKERITYVDGRRTLLPDPGPPTEAQLAELRGLYDLHIEWELNAFSGKDADRWHTRPIYILAPGPAGKSTFDRLGEIHY